MAGAVKNKKGSWFAYFTLNAVVGIAAVIIGSVVYYGLLVNNHNNLIKAELPIIISILEVRDDLDEETDKAAVLVVNASVVANQARKRRASPDIQEAAIMEYERAVKSLNALVGDEMLDPLVIRKQKDVPKSVFRTLTEDGGILPYLVSVGVIMLMVVFTSILTSGLIPKEKETEI